MRVFHFYTPSPLLMLLLRAKHNLNIEGLQTAYRRGSAGGTVYDRTSHHRKRVKRSAKREKARAQGE